MSPSTKRPSGSAFRLISVVALNWRRFRLGTRSVPPAMNMAPGCLAASSVASPTDRGRRESSRGRRSTYLPLHSSGAEALIGGGNARAGVDAGPSRLPLLLKDVNAFADG